MKDGITVNIPYKHYQDLLICQERIRNHTIYSIIDKEEIKLDPLRLCLYDQEIGYIINSKLEYAGKDEFLSKMKDDYNAAIDNAKKSLAALEQSYVGKINAMHTELSDIGFEKIEIEKQLAAEKAKRLPVKLKRLWGKVVDCFAKFWGHATKS